MGTIESGILEQMYVTKEVSYNTLIATPASTDAVRAIESALTPKHGRAASNEKRGTPDDFQNLTARDSFAWEISTGMWEPSGTLGTPSYWGPLLKGGFGAQHTIGAGLATTVNAAPSPTATGCTLISATGLTVGDAMIFVVGGKREVTIIRSIASLAVTYDALTGAPDVPGAAIAGVTYSLASVLGDSFQLSKFYNGASNQETVNGAVVDKMGLSFDGTKPVMITLSGPAGNYVRAGVTKPGAFTTAGTPQAGTVGQFILGAAAFPVITAGVTITNNVGLRNNELGTAIATGSFRTQNRKVEVKCSFYFDNTALLTAADALTRQELRLLLGSVNGKQIGLVVPSVEWEYAPIGKELGPKILSATGVGFASSGNDSVVAFEA